jgi:hypothetical protein
MDIKMQEQDHNNAKIGVILKEVLVSDQHLALQLCKLN